MMAYENQVQQSPTPGAAEAGVVTKSKTVKKMQVTRRPNGVLEQTTENVYMIPVAAGEVVLLILMLVLNYLFRFNESVRDSSSIADYGKLTLDLADVSPARPYFNYSKSIDENQDGDFTFGITFTMKEYAFFVPVFILPLLLILLVELLYLWFPKGHLKTVKSFDINFNTFSRRSMRIYYVFLLYGSLTGMVAAFIKLLVPKPRPHFLAICVTKRNLYAFVVNDTCINSDWSDLNEALRSFPSYHATIAFYSGTFLVLYLMYMTQRKGTYSAGGLCSLPIVVMAIIGGLHRWCTFHADGWDVTWGGGIGVVGAVWAVYGILNCFKEKVWALNLEPNDPETVSVAQGKTPSTKSGPAYTNPSYSANGNLASSPRPNPYSDGRRSSMAPRVQAQTSPPPPRSPAQAFNTGFEPESPTGVSPQFNVPRQRYSIPAVQMRPMYSSSRPASAYPVPPSMERRPVSRYEGASYF